MNKKLWYSCSDHSNQHLQRLVFYLYPNPQIKRRILKNCFGEWVADADVPQDPNNPGHLVEWNITRVTNVTHSGQYSLKFFIDGRQDDGTIWIERKISIKNSQIQIKVSFEFYVNRRVSIL